jgi:hypothetical protein
MFSVGGKRKFAPAAPHAACGGHNANVVVEDTAEPPAGV